MTVASRRLRSRWQVVRSLRWWELLLVPYAALMLLGVHASLRRDRVERAIARSRRWAGWLPLSSAADDPGAASRLGTAVRGGALVVPSDVTCLRRSIVLAALCDRRGLEIDIVLGVRRGDDEQIVAHAWVELDGRVVSERAARIAGYERLQVL